MSNTNLPSMPAFPQPTQLESIMYQIPENPFEENSWEYLQFNARPHDVFPLDWLSYSSVAFGNHLLPYIKNYIRAKAVWMDDGAELFKDIHKVEQKLFTLDEDKLLINLISFSYPKGVLAEEYKYKIRVSEYEVATFIELDQFNNIDIHFKFGRKFKNFLENYLKSNGNSGGTKKLEGKVYKTNVTKLKSFFNRQLVHYNMMSFILHTLSVDYESIETLNELFDLSNYEIDVPYFENESSEIDCEDGFLSKFDKFIKSLPKVTATNLDCEIQFFRSKEQSKNRYSKSDKGYNGSFGFDRYDKRRSGNGQLSLKYFPNVVNIDDNYKAPFLSLWPPKNKLTSKIKVNPTFSPVSKAEIWFKVEQNKETKDTSKNSGKLYFDTTNSSVLINGKMKGEIGNESGGEFSVGDTHKFLIECKNLIKDYVFIVFREADQDGKVVGILNVVPNDKIYTTKINVVDVTLGTANNLEKSTTANPLASSLYLPQSLGQKFRKIKEYNLTKFLS